MYKFMSSLQSWLVKLLYSIFSRILTEFSTIFKENIVILGIFSKTVLSENSNSLNLYPTFMYFLFNFT